MKRILCSDQIPSLPPENIIRFLVSVKGSRIRRGVAPLTKPEPQAPGWALVEILSFLCKGHKKYQIEDLALLVCFPRLGVLVL